VYIKAGHRADSFYLSGFGPVFTSRISITQSASLPAIVEKWTQWFQHEDGKLIINTKRDKEDGSEKEKDAHSPEATPCPKTTGDIEEDDQKRLRHMEKSIRAFEKEVMEVIIDFGPIIQGVRPDDRLAVVFHVADDAYFEQYHTDTLQVQVDMGTLKKLSGESIDSDTVTRAFQWNIDRR